MGRAQAVRQFLVNLERARLQKLRREWRRGNDGDDLVVIAVRHRCRHSDALQVFGEVRLRERLDAVVLRFRAAHHALAPPIPDDRLRWFAVWPVVAVERTAREIEIELRAIGGERLAQAIEYFDG